MPQISVIVPVYKVELYIRRCIDSILAQTFSDYELILVDDGSPDKCGAVCDEYAKQDNRIHVLHQENAGLSVARNTGIDWTFSHSDSKWLTLIVRDDWVHPRYLEALFLAVQKTGLPLATVAHKRTDGQELKIDESLLEAKVMTTLSCYCNKAMIALAPWGKLYRKDLFQDIRYPRGRLQEDEFTTYKLLFLCEKMACVWQPLYAYFQNPAGITNAANQRKRCLDKIDATIEQIVFFSQRRYVVAEMQRLVICVDKIKEFYSKTKGTSEEQIRHVGDIKKKLSADYPNAFWFSGFLKRHPHKSLYPVFYYIYKTYVSIRKTLRFSKSKMSM